MLAKSLPLIVAAACLTTASSAFTFFQDSSAGDEMVAAAKAFTETLDDQQRKAVLLPYDGEARVQWHFIPMDERKGLPLAEMNNRQKRAARNLVRASLSAMGARKTRQIMKLEELLQQMEGPDRRWPRDPEMYYVTLFGEPAESGKWGLSFEGHHLSLNFVVNDGEIASATPQFFGANPATVMQENDVVEKGTRVLAREEQLAFDLVNSLNDEQKAKAIIDQTAPRDIRAAGEPQPPQTEPVGISAADLDQEQKKTLRQLVLAYLNAVPDEEANERRDLLRQTRPRDLHFTWAGATEPGVGHYYRIQSPEMLIEFVNTQPDALGNPANHIHSVYRDLRGDFAVTIK